MATSILPRNRQPRPPGRHTPLKIHKGLLENRRNTNGQALLQVSVVGHIDRNETSAALATHAVQIPIPALLNHDYTYYMDQFDKVWLDNTNYQCRVEERIAQEPRSADIQEICGRLFISEDDFELVMGLFETLTGPQLHQELPDFSIFKPFFLAPLHPDTFASHVVPSWI
ncbi:hypothetical protein B0H14DRAFT_3554249 [Mycena olivaceomarginata]|nr:hypothetical protein B0H14DRAFT_3554249 [Mycena olivaceomarginata]